jgi:hypothetical protein
MRRFLTPIIRRSKAFWARLRPMRYSETRTTACVCSAGRRGTRLWSCSRSRLLSARTPRSSASSIQWRCDPCRYPPHINLFSSSGRRAKNRLRARLRATAVAQPAPSSPRRRPGARSPTLNSSGFTRRRMCSPASLHSFPGWQLSTSTASASNSGARTSLAIFSPRSGRRWLWGHPLAPSDDHPRAAPVIVLSYRYWQTELRADPGIVGKMALVDRQPFRIIGIADRDFPTLDSGWPCDFWLPLVAQPSVDSHSPSQTDANSLWLEVIGRLKPDVSTTRAEAELNTIVVSDVTIGSKPLFDANDAPRLTCRVQPRG